MNELKIFENPKFGKVRTLTEGDVTLFCGLDITNALGYKNSRKALADHCKGVTKRYVGVQTGVKADGTAAIQQVEMNFIPEGDIYRLAAQSELPGAEEFESWIFDVVLPSIRKNGGYIMGQEELSDEELMARALVVAKKTIDSRDERLSGQPVVQVPEREWAELTQRLETLEAYATQALALPPAAQRAVKRGQMKEAKIEALTKLMEKATYDEVNTVYNYAVFYVQ